MKRTYATKRTLGNALMLIPVLTFMVMTGCDNTEGAFPSGAAVSDIPAAQDRTWRTVTDQDNRRVRLPESIDRVIVTSFPLPAVCYAVTGSCKKIVGIHPAVKSKARISMLGVLAPELMNMAAGFVKGKDLNIEEALKLEPDLFIFWGLYPRQRQQFDAIDIPAVAVHTISGGNAMETLNTWITLVGSIFQEEEKAAELIAYNLATMEMIASRLRGVPQKRRPKVLILYYHSAEEINIPGTGHYGHFWITSTGAVNMAACVSGRVSVNMEQIYQWNPDIIYISNFSDTLPEALLQNTVEGQNWSIVNAVKKGKVYKIPLGIYGWYPPNPDAPLMLKWMAQKNHPELFRDFTIEEEIKKFYSRFYHYQLSDEQVERILHPVRSAAKGSRM